MHRYELSDAQWLRVASFLPHPRHHGHAGHPWNAHRPLVQGILWILHTGAPWRDLPERYGPWQTVYCRFRRWRQDGTWDRIVTTLLDDLDRRGRLGRQLWCIDGTIIRATRAAAGARRRPRRRPRLGGHKATQLEEPSDHALGRSRGGFSTKVHLVCEQHGLLLGVFVTPGQRHECKFFDAVLLRAQRPRRRGRHRWPERLAGDKGYSYLRPRRWLRRRHIQAVIPTRKNQKRDPHFDKKMYRRRNIIERVVGWYKECRRLVTRFEKLAINYVAFWMVAMMEKFLRKLLPNRA